MSASKVKQVSLKGVLEHTASSAKIRDDQSLVIELYDFSPQAEQWLGNEVAFLLVIAPKYKEEIISRLREVERSCDGGEEQDHLLLRLIAEKFVDYYEVKSWLEENGIPYEKQFDPWA